MDIRIRNSSDDPIYLQIKNQIRDAIVEGELEEGEMLPSIRLLAKELRVSVITTKRAYDELENEGFIHAVQGKGSFVAAQNRELLRERLLKEIEASLEEALRYAKMADLTVGDLAQLLEALAETEEAVENPGRD